MTISTLKKTLALLLATALLSAAFAACSAKPEMKNDTETAKSGAGDDTAEETTARLYPDLAPRDFDGYEFTFLARHITNVDWTEWDHRDLTPVGGGGEQNGDVINDSVFARNLKIEEKYNIKITEMVVENPEVETRVATAVRSGDDVYDAVCPHVIQFPPTAQSGYYVDLFTAPCLDLEKPWWNQGTIRDLSIIHKLFIIQGDLLILDNDAMEAMIFNKALLADLQFDSPYDIVNAGAWTLDKLIEMTAGVRQDLNGDGKMYIKDDRFGCILQADSNVSFVISCGDKVCSKDKDDYPIITFGSDKSYSICDKISTLMLDEENVVNLHRYVDKFGVYDEQVKMMEENRALFSWIRMRIVERLRGMEADFGLIPLPKYNEEQEHYITHMNPHTGAGISIPVVASDLERTGMILEDLCAESRYTLQPAYYDINLRGKYARDTESEQMLDIILENTAHDIGYVYNFGGFAMSALLYNGMNKKSDYASPFAAALPKMEKEIAKVVEEYEKIGGLG